MSVKLKFLFSIVELFNKLRAVKIKNYLQESPIFAINAAYEAVIPKVNRQLKGEGLNLMQGLVLTALFFEQGSEISPSQLAVIFRTSRGNMSHILSDLEYKGYVRRIVHPKDARQFLIELKPEGRKKAVSLIKFYDKLQEFFEKQLGVGGCQKTTAGIHELARSFVSFSIPSGRK